MSRRRSISTDISVDPKLAMVAEEYGAIPLLLYTWAIPHADDMGHLTADPLKFKLLVCPALPIKCSEIKQVIQQLADAGLWSIVGTDDRTEINFPSESWFKHQSYIPNRKRSKDAKSAEEQQLTPSITANYRQLPQITSSPSPSPSPSPSLTQDSIGANFVAPDTKKEVKKFQKPEQSEVRAYFIDRGLPELLASAQSQKFYDYQESKGWVVGKSPMKDWKAASRTWIGNMGDWQQQAQPSLNGHSPPPQSTIRTQEFIPSVYGDDD